MAKKKCCGKWRKKGKLCKKCPIDPEIQTQIRVSMQDKKKVKLKDLETKKLKDKKKKKKDKKDKKDKSNV